MPIVCVTLAAGLGVLGVVIGCANELVVNAIISITNAHLYVQSFFILVRGLFDKLVTQADANKLLL